MLKLAATYWGKGGNQLEDGRELERRVLEDRKRLLGEEHPDTLIA